MHNETNVYFVSSYSVHAYRPFSSSETFILDVNELRKHFLLEAFVSKVRIYERSGQMILVKKKKKGNIFLAQYNSGYIVVAIRV